MITIDSCPVCKGNKFTPFVTCKDYTVSKKDFNIVSCNGCNFKLTSPRPDDASMGDYYKSEEYISHSNTSKGIISKLYHLVRKYTLKKKIDLVSKHVSRGTILDYGCGIGMFLNVCQESGWEAFGMEPDEGARKIAAEMKLRTYENKQSLKQGLANTKLDAITMWHALEHVTDLKETLAFFKESLKQSGVLIIAVPNYTSFDAKHYKEFWAAYDVPRHLYHFEINTITKLLGPFGFKLIETRPMRFDSFYVSMLSEKYKTGSIRYLNAFMSGLRSNLKAKAAEDYSSVIYIFKQA